MKNLVCFLIVSIVAILGACAEEEEIDNDIWNVCTPWDGCQPTNTHPPGNNTPAPSPGNHPPPPPPPPQN